MIDRTRFGPETTADEVLEGFDLTGKRVLITGASGGLGAETARAMAVKGAEVIVTARNVDKMRDVVTVVKAATGAELAVETLELGSFASIRAFAERFLAKYDRLDIVINNAGVMACPESKTEDGIELQFGSNHLGHFLMTNLIARTLGKGARVVALSSAAHVVSPVVFDDIQFEKRAYDKWKAYGQSKTANALFAVALNARLKGRGVEAFSVHPGAIMTDLGRHHGEEDLARARKAMASGKMSWKTVAAGAATSVYAATAPELASKGGAYLADCTISPISADQRNFAVVRPYAVDPAVADRLWAVSEKMVGHSFGG
jgi:NAD(P)-dependent dehydrogenase (short-subunit alcohol dehydrogenase family)